MTLGRDQLIVFLTFGMISLGEFGAKTCGCRDKRKNKVTYSIVDSHHNLCLDKKDIIYAEIVTSDTLLKDVSLEEDKKAIELEIAELKMTLDLMT
jgi:hypothetical protein